MDKPIYPQMYMLSAHLNQCPKCIDRTLDDLCDIGNYYVQQHRNHFKLYNNLSSLYKEQQELYMELMRVKDSHNEELFSLADIASNSMIVYQLHVAKCEVCKHKLTCPEREQLAKKFKDDIKVLEVASIL